MDLLQSFSLLFATLPSLIRSLNPLDVVIVAVFIFYAVEGFTVGFTIAFFDFLSFLLSFLLGLKGYSIIGAALTGSFGIPHGFANAIGFFLLAFVSEIIFSILFHKIYGKAEGLFSPLQEAFATSHEMITAYLQSLNRFLGILPGMASAFVLLSFLLTLIITLPFSPFLKKTVATSALGNVLTIASQGFEKRLHDVFGEAAQDTLNFLTITPQSETTVQLGFTATQVSIDEEAEVQMVELINKERAAKGFRPVIVNKKLQDVARSHAKDMLARGYFSHYTPEGLSPFDRLAIANIRYAVAGENLALAPGVTLAMQGFMNSPGHRANILSANFGKVGIGAIDGGVYGIMFAQEFTD